MLRRARRFVAAFALLALMLAPATGALAAGQSRLSTESETAPPMFDVLVMRPLGLVGLGVSAAFWIPAQAITMVARPSEWRKPVESMLIAPYEFVFVDPLGSH